ncbi:Solvent efflux pump outer membrane protein SrpC [Pseudomonas fluorescens]|uniref:Solvent efflux pump outer membrane protein SrpC n=1 Tax=Pseudomonas fluorescens TaxID=294 RepID=A0A5E7TGE5_PSEFL|nr:efflux transporter outer membrane subunit [Pseudomonas fluorescens]VVP98231.1 Solvent efflux pump outer membrane protein SrpC [Pseudomonas fluorescens]
MIYRTPLLTLLLLSALAGCASQSNPAMPLQEIPSTTASGPALDSLAQRWWESFEDPALNRLMTDALRDNLNLAAAAERVREVRAQHNLAATELYPEIGAVARYGRSRTALDGASTKYSYGVDLAWELDLFGRLKALRNEAGAELNAAQQDYLSLRLTLMAEVANNYLQYRLARQLMGIATETGINQAHTARVTRARLEQGSANRLDLERIESQVAITQAEIPTARQQAQSASYNLAYLLASEQPRIDSLLAETPPSSIRFSESALPQLLSIPAEVLRERPDVRAAEQRLLAAGESLVAEKAARYPQLTLGVLAMFEQGGAAPWALTSQLFQPLFNFGRLDSQIEASDARREQARLAYQQSLLQALREAHTSIHAYGQGINRQHELDKATAAAARAVDLARQQYQAGTVSMLEVLDAERSLFSVQRSQAQAKVDVALRWVDINRTLGIAPMQTSPEMENENREVDPDQNT